jgi:hypothetical protein
LVRVEDNECFLVYSSFDQVFFTIALLIHKRMFISDIHAPVQKPFLDRLRISPTAFRLPSKARIDPKLYVLEIRSSMLTLKRNSVKFWEHEILE